MANAGGSWDNAKKYIEAGHHGGKGTDAHKAGVVGDTVGDPFKDTSGPSLNILIKLMSMVSVVVGRPGRPLQPDGPGHLLNRSWCRYHLPSIQLPRECEFSGQFWCLFRGQDRLKSFASAHRRDGTVSRAATGAMRTLPVNTVALQFLQRLDHLLVVTVDLDALPDLGHLAVGIDQERRALDSHRLLAVHVLFPPGAVFLGDFVVRIGQQREVQVYLSRNLTWLSTVSG